MLLAEPLCKKLKREKEESCTKNCGVCEQKSVNTNLL